MRRSFRNPSQEARIGCVSHNLLLQAPESLVALAVEERQVDVEDPSKQYVMSSMRVVVLFAA